MSSVLVSTDSGDWFGLPTSPAVYPKSSYLWPSIRNVWPTWGLS